MVSLLLGASLAALLVLGVALAWNLHRARRSAAPFFPTPQRAIRTALAAAELKPGETFYDLGAGTGRALVIAEKEFGARAAGFEISWLFYAIANLNLMLRGAKARVQFKSLWDADLREANVIFFFLVERVLPKMAEKLRRELKPGTRIVVYAFPLPGMQPKQTIPIYGQWNVFIYSA